MHFTRTDGYPAVPPHIQGANHRLYDIRVFYRGDQWEWHTHEPLFAFQLPMEVAVDRIELVNYDRQHYDLVVSLPGSGVSPRRSAGSRRLCAITTFLNENIGALGRQHPGKYNSASVCYANMCCIF